MLKMVAMIAVVVGIAMAPVMAHACRTSTVLDGSSFEPDCRGARSAAHMAEYDVIAKNEAAKPTSTVLDSSAFDASA
ncbi:MAG: hypothetical protein GY851_04320 [bacterium]|nr:hypothetical protein [bacterium]